MTKIKFKIDEKSLFFGIYNDYISGQTPTVSTPLNQSTNPTKWKKDVLSLCNKNLHLNKIPPMLLKKCTRNTTSQAKTKVDYIFVFNNLKLDGKPLNCKHSFAFYIKEEIDEFIKSKTKGKMVKNTHLGRKKLHYPQTLKYKTDGLNIDNHSVLEDIIKQNGGFAYIVRGFECDLEDKSLNFITSIVGLEGIFLSSVFKKQKGVGKKLLLKEINIAAQDLPHIDIAHLIDSDYRSCSNSIDFDKINKSRIENGKLGEKIIFNYISETFKSATDIYHTSIDFPTSPYDIEFYLDGVKKYVEVKSTSSVKKIFNMSCSEIKFMNSYKEDYILYLVTDVKNEFPKIEMFSHDKIKKLKKEYPTTRFYA
ncbi:MAG: DUF3883 domain-containing protein [Alphaproteobacteria bacterium]|nr:DUF3883 domain-containing protein [Alphaproteobacteria bacterium]